MSPAAARATARREWVAGLQGPNSLEFVLSVDNQGACVGTREEGALIGIEQHPPNRDAPLPPDPGERGRDVGHQRGVIALPADAAGDALNAGAIEMPGTGVEPDPGFVARRQMAEIVLLVVCDHAPGMRI